MFKKLLVLLILFLGLSSNFAVANDITVVVYAPKKITTSNNDLKIGDYVEFKILNDVYLNSKLYISKDELVTGLITDLVGNKCAEEAAYMRIEDFKVKNVSGNAVDLRGFIYVTGNDHWMYWKQTNNPNNMNGSINLWDQITNPNYNLLLRKTVLFVHLCVRGGEVQIKPKDTFNLYIKE